MRLTEKDQMGYYGYFTYKTDEIEIINKLGQLEDIEEELGVDLITLCNKATKEVWYTKLEVDFDYSNWHKINGQEIVIKNSIVSRLDFQHKSVYIKGAKQWFDIKDYGKTWALTKEELE